VKPTVPDQIDLNVADASSSQPLQSCCDDQLNPPITRGPAELPESSHP
jgi:hypothetical protein